MVRRSTPFVRAKALRKNTDIPVLSGEVKSFEDFSTGINAIEKAKLSLFDKAMQSGDPNVLEKARQYFSEGTNNPVTGSSIKSMMVDPMDFASSFGFKDKPTRLTYFTLKKMAATPFSALTINTRINQVLKFCKPQPDEYTIGFKIRLKDRNKEVTYEDEVNIEKLTNFLLDGGFGGSRWGRDDFETFAAKVMRDSLTYDQFTFEILENKRGIPQEFFATDASTYRIAFPDNDTSELKSDPLTGQEVFPHVVQTYQSGIENEFYPWELAFGIRRPRTDLMVAGYGYAELEELVNIVTGMLYSDEYNRKFFSQGSAPKGIIRLAANSGISDNKLKEFKRQWQMQMAGVYNSWKTPIMEADKMDWIDLTKSNRDMEFSAWQEYMIKIHSALFLIDPSEIGFDISKSQGTSTMFESNNEARIKYSKDKGLTPLLTNLQKYINRNLIRRIDERYEFVFVGADVSEDQALEKAIKELSNFKTIDEIRTQFDLEPLSEEQGGNLILNNNWMSWYNNKLIREDQEQEDQDNGMDFGNEDGSYDPLTDEEAEQQEELQKANINPFEEDLKILLGDLKK